MAFFIFILNLIEHSVSKQCEEPDQKPRSAASGLVLRYMPMYHKKALGLYGLNSYLLCASILSFQLVSCVG